MTYSANNELRILAEKLGFKLFIFDDRHNLGPEIKLKEATKDEEVDAIMLYENLICLIGITISPGRDTKDKDMRDYFEGLDKTEDIHSAKFKIVTTAKPNKNVQEKTTKGEELLRQVENHIQQHKEDYKIILRKLYFAPEKRFDEQFLQEQRKYREFIIDKDVYEYFLEVSSRLNHDFLFFDFMHFLDIKKMDLEKISASGTGQPAKSSPKKISRLELLRDKMIMYSCSVRIEEIQKYVTVLRMAHKYDKKGFQRMIKATRLEKIASEYLSKNETFPNNIIIALNPSVYTKEEGFYQKNSENETLSLFDEFNSLIIIDGQHRFFSFIKGNRTGKSILVTFIFFSGVNKEENEALMDQMFYNINKTQERIDPNLGFLLKAKIDPQSEESFWFEVFKRLDEKGFFAGRFTFKEPTLRAREGKKSIISVITYGGVLKLNTSFKRKNVQVDGLKIFYKSDRSKQITFAYNLLRNYFDIIENVLHSQGVEKERLTPREIGALIRLLSQFILTEKNKVKRLGSDKETLRAKHPLLVNYFRKILNAIDFKKTIASEYSASNWAAVEGHMLKQIHKANKKNTKFGSRDILSRKGLQEYRKPLRK